MERWILFLFIGLLCNLAVIANNHDEAEDSENTLEKLKAKIDNLERLLYKVLVATKYPNNDVCPVEETEEDGMGCNKGVINCTSIDLHNMTSNCQKCVHRDWKSDEPCKFRFTPMKEPMNITNKDKSIQIQINGNGVVSGFTIHNSTFEEVKGGSNCSCTWSQYSYNNKSSEVSANNKTKQFLYCDCSEDYYCLGDDQNKACYERKGDCTVSNNSKVSCTTSDSTTPVKNVDCAQGEKCKFKISVSDENIHVDDNTWSDGSVSSIKGCGDTQVKHPSLKDLCKSKDGGSGDGHSGGGGNGDGNNSENSDEPETPNYTFFLIIIIVILLLLLVSYFGYQNQWHHKISNCVNGTEGEARPPPTSGRRGRMKGKYAPLPRAMEESVRPHHND